MWHNISYIVINMNYVGIGFFKMLAKWETHAIINTTYKCYYCRLKRTPHINSTVLSQSLPEGALRKLHLHLCYHNQSTVSTAKRLASLFWYLIASTIDTLHYTINGYAIACTWNSKYNVHVCMIQTNADFIFQKLIVFVSFDFKLRKSS